MNRDLRAASSTFPKGKKRGILSSHFGIHLWLLPGKGAQYTKNFAINAFTNPMTCFLCNVGENWKPLNIVGSSS